MEINVTLDVMLAKRKMSVTELSQRIGITMANVSILKNGKAKGIKFARSAMFWTVSPAICWNLSVRTEYERGKCKDSTKR